MVPIYAIASFISLFSLQAAFFIDVIRDIYEVSYELLSCVPLPLCRCRMFGGGGRWAGSISLLRVGPWRDERQRQHPRTRFSERRDLGDQYLHVHSIVCIGMCDA